MVGVMHGFDYVRCGVQGESRGEAKGGKKEDGDGGGAAATYHWLCIHLAGEEFANVHCFRC